MWDKLIYTLVTIEDGFPSRLEKLYDRELYDSLVNLYQAMLWVPKHRPFGPVAQEMLFDLIRFVEFELSSCAIHAEYKHYNDIRDFLRQAENSLHVACDAYMREVEAD